MWFIFGEAQGLRNDSKTETESKVFIIDDIVSSESQYTILLFQHF